METTRQNKVCRLIQKELSEIFLLQTKAMNGVLVSVSAVRISPDMSIVRAYLSVFPSNRAEEIVKNINNNTKAIRFELGSRVRHQLRIIPELKFFVDDSILKNGSVAKGSRLYEEAKVKGANVIKEEFSTNTDYYEIAEESAEIAISNLVYEVNQGVKDLKVTVEFY